MGSWGVDGGWMPLPTRPQQYCDPASLVLRWYLLNPSSKWRVSVIMVMSMANISGIGVFNGEY